VRQPLKERHLQRATLSCRHVPQCPADAEPDIIFQFRFKTEIRNPGVFTVAVGGIAGIPPITKLDGPAQKVSACARRIA
jgi:hypothetical protein